ncbi:MAG: thiamine-monophosphate kinase [Candidatus Riflebacteria bacterium]|nr:thiamine-monophosphate kinase [Candidatus Riflebacteria bacterium]
MNLQLSKINEFGFISQLTQGFQRSPNQLNGIHESDAELIHQTDGSYIAITIDTLLEEYKLGIIRSPYIVGWSLIAHSLSDLAAVGADPIGLLNALILPRKPEKEWNENLFKGMQDSLSWHQTYCLGGDTSVGEESALSCVALGRIPADRSPLTRLGAKLGDVFYITGPLGLGNQLAVAKRIDANLWASLEKRYLPKARLKEVLALRKWMKCAIDTSDALLQGMAILSALNGVGIRFEHRDELYPPDLVEMAKKVNFPLWTINTFGLGEYEILFAVEKNTEAEFLQDAAKKSIYVKKIGEAIKEPEIKLVLNNRDYTLDAPYLLNLLGQTSSIDEYYQKLMEYHAKLISR